MNTTWNFSFFTFINQVLGLQAYITTSDLCGAKDQTQYMLYMLHNHSTK